MCSLVCTPGIILLCDFSQGDLSEYLFILDRAGTTHQSNQYTKVQFGNSVSLLVILQNIDQRLLTATWVTSCESIIPEPQCTTQRHLRQLETSFLYNYYFMYNCRKGLCESCKFQDLSKTLEGFLNPELYKFNLLSETGTFSRREPVFACKLGLIIQPCLAWNSTEIPLPLLGTKAICHYTQPREINSEVIIQHISTSQISV